MGLVRFLFIGMLAVHLTGIPVAGLSPCAAGGTGTHNCCMRHQVDRGGAVIGHCCCQSAPESADDDAVLSVPAPSPESLVAGAPATTATADVAPVSDASFPILFARPAAPTHGPPRLTGAGFRC
jgi:hypothetical protein